VKKRSDPAKAETERKKHKQTKSKALISIGANQLSHKQIIPPAELITRTARTAKIIKIILMPTINSQCFKLFMA
jgi:hypothetical protein